jgi:hypothetical protein
MGLFCVEKARFPPLMEKGGYEAELGKGGNLFAPRGSNGVGKGTLSLSLLEKIIDEKSYCGS